MADLYFRDAIEARDSITVRQKREIRKLYNEWARDIRDTAKGLSNVEGSQDAQRDLAKLYYELRTQSKVLSTEIDKSIRKNISDVSDITVRTNKRWLNKLGFTNGSIDIKFSKTKDMVLRNIISGNIYQGGYNLSTRVWNLTDYNMRDIYTVIARGVAENKTVYQIAKDLEKYVNPSKMVPTKIQFGKGNKIHNMKVDYNAQRLAKTLIQHTYQQTLVSLTKDNPFVDGYIWHARGGHPCQLCLDRDGTLYSADDIPLDHPNGECEIEPNINMVKVMNDLSGWLDNPIEYPDIETFTRGLEYITN